MSNHGESVSTKCFVTIENGAPKFFWGFAPLEGAIVVVAKATTTVIRGISVMDVTTLSSNIGEIPDFSGFPTVGTDPRNKFETHVEQMCFEQQVAKHL